MWTVWINGALTCILQKESHRHSLINYIILFILYKCCKQKKLTFLFSFTHTDTVYCLYNEWTVVSFLLVWLVTVKIHFKSLLHPTKKMSENN